MGRIVISSTQNPVVKRIRLVASGSGRAGRDLVLAEGLRLLEEALSSGLALETVLLTEGFGSKPREDAFLGILSGKGYPFFRATGSLFRQLSDVAAPQGALALVRVPSLSLEDIPHSPEPLLVCVCGARDPGNMGTLMRIAWAAGAAAVVSTPGTVSFRNAKSVRASAGAVFRVPVVENCPAFDFQSLCRDRGIQAYRADVRAGVSCWQADLARPIALLLGSEANGLDPTEWKGVPAIHIPMAEDVESLNVASAGAVLLFEAVRQRRTLA